MKPPVHTFAKRASQALLALTASLASCVSTIADRESLDGMGVPPRSFDEGGDRVPTVATLHSMARVLAVRGNDAQGELVLRHLISNHPAYTPAYNELAELYLRSGETQKALAAIDAGLAVAPQDRVLLNNRGMVYLLEEDYEAALREFDAGLEICPDDLDLRSNRALALGMLGREGDALAAYMEILSLAQAHHNMAVICSAIGNEEAAERYRKLADRLGRPY